MSSMQEDIQCAGSDTRPPMLDRTDFESWQQRIRLYCLGKDNGENIMKSIKEGPFHMGTVSDVIAGGTEGAVQQGPVRARVLNDLSAEEKESLLKVCKKMLHEWSRFIIEVNLMRFERVILCSALCLLKQHEVHANENRIMMERFIQPNNDPLALVSDASVQQYPTQSSKSPQPSKEPSPADNFQLDSGSSLTENLIESLSNTLALLTQSYKSHLPQTNNQLRASSNARNKAMVQDGKVVVQDVRGRYNATNQGRPFQRNNARGNGVAGNVTNVDDDVDDSPENDWALNMDHIFEADECDAFDSDVDEGPTSQTMFMANLTSEDPIYDEAGPSYDSNNPFEVQDHDTFVDHMDEYHEVHEMQNDVQHNYVVDSDADYTSDSNITPYDQYLLYEMMH
ncbi:hypothetical protein Tco_0365826 [Tanacetum coccineum]